MKKISTILVLIMALAFSFGCYRVQAGKLKDIVGTYELTSYNRTGWLAEDYMVTDGIKCYLVIENATSGYYIYQDNYTPLSVRKINIRMEASQDEPDKYEYVYLNLDPATEEVKLGYSRGTLNVTDPKHKGHLFDPDFVFNAAQVHINYKKINKATDLTHVEKLVEDMPEVTPYGFSAMDGIYVHSWYRYLDSSHGEISAIYDEPFVYAYVDLSVFDKTATVYYMMKSNEVEKEVNYNVELTNENGKYYVQMGEESIEIEIISNSVYMYLPETCEVNGEIVDFHLRFDRYTRDSVDVEDLILNAIANYDSEADDQDSPDDI